MAELTYSPRMGEGKAGGSSTASASGTPGRPALLTLGSHEEAPGTVRYEDPSSPSGQYSPRRVRPGQSSLGGAASSQKAGARLQRAGEEDEDEDWKGGGFEARAPSLQVQSAPRPSATVEGPRAAARSAQQQQAQQQGAGGATAAAARRRRLWDMGHSPGQTAYGPLVDVGEAAAPLRGRDSVVAAATATRPARRPASASASASAARVRLASASPAPVPTGVPPYVPAPTHRELARAHDNRQAVLQRKLEKVRQSPWVVADWTKNKPTATAAAAEVGTDTTAGTASLAPRSAIAASRAQQLQQQHGGSKTAAPKAKAGAAAVAGGRPRSAPSSPTRHRLPGAGAARAAGAGSRRPYAGLVGPLPAWLAPLTPAEIARLPAGTYKQLEDVFMEDYISVHDRLARVLDRCTTFQDSYLPAAPPAWQLPYPGGANLLASVGGGPSLTKALGAAANAAAEAAGFQSDVARALGEGSASLTRQAALASVGAAHGAGTAPASMLVGPSPAAGSLGAASLLLLQQQPQGLHAGAAPYTTTTARSLAPGYGGPATPASLGLGLGAAAAAPSAVLGGAAAGITTTGGYQQQQAWAALSPSPGALSPRSPSPWDATWEPYPLTFKESTCKFTGNRSQGISQAVAGVFREAHIRGAAAGTAGSGGEWEGLSHRERLQAGLRELNAEWFGAVLGPAPTYLL